MSQAAMDAKWLQGKQVAFTGRLASMTRTEAGALIKAFGGEFVAAVKRSTSILVIGQEGWPLRKDGALSRKLVNAERLKRGGHAIVILPEADLMAGLGLEARSDIQRLYTTAQLCRLLHVPRDRIRAWMKAGMLEPVKTTHGVCYFDFPQIAGVKTLIDLTSAGVTPKKLRQSLDQLRRWIPDLDRPLAQLAIIERDGELLLRKDGRLTEPSGQGLFDFADQRAPVVAAPSAPETAAEWFDTGCAHETAGDLQNAAMAYRRVLMLGGPAAEVCFNLANVLYALGQKEAAAERYRQVIEIDCRHAAAWNNLGNVLAELRHSEDALESYGKALELDPRYAEALYNLADTLDDMDRPREAKQHWQAYLRLEPEGPSADYARSRLAAIELARLA